MGIRTNSAVWTESRKRWQINVQKDGIRKTFVSAKPGRSGQREANAKADAWLDEGIENTSSRVSEQYEEFLKHKEETTSLSNYRPMRTRWESYIKPTIGRIQVSKMNDYYLQLVIDRSKKKSGDLPAQKTLKNVRSDLVAFCSFLRKKKLSTYLPENLSIPSTSKKPNKNIIQPDGIKSLLTIDKTIYHNKEITDPLIHYYRLAVLTGMRPGELLGVRWDDVNGSTILLKRSINMYGQITNGKNDNAKRTVSLSPMALSEIEAQRAISGHDLYVFPNVKEQNALKRWKVYCAHNGIQATTLYEMRHTFVSATKAIPEGLIKQQVGHSVDMDTYGYYGHDFSGENNALSSALQDVFFEIKSRKKEEAK